MAYEKLELLTTEQLEELAKEAQEIRKRKLEEFPNETALVTAQEKYKAKALREITAARAIDEKLIKFREEIDQLDQVLAKGITHKFTLKLEIDMVLVASYQSFVDVEDEDGEAAICFSVEGYTFSANLKKKGLTEAQHALLSDSVDNFARNACESVTNLAPPHPTLEKTKKKMLAMVKKVAAMDLDPMLLNNTHPDGNVREVISKYPEWAEIVLTHSS